MYIQKKYAKKILKSLNDIHTLKKLIKINKLVISGGGMKGLSFIGAVKYIEELNIINSINEFYGCSIGGLISSLLVLNYNCDELIKFILNFNFLDLVNPNINSLMNDYSVASSDNFIIFIKKLILRKNDNVDITLKQLYKLNNKKLNLIGFNLTNQTEVVFNYITYPDLELWKAIYITCALPTLLSPLLYHNNYYCDGGISNNNPINLISDYDQINTLCITTNVFKFESNIINELINKKNIFNYIKYMSNILYIIFNKKENYKVDKYNNIILIDNCNECNDSVNFNIDIDIKFSKIMNGYKCCKKYIPIIFEYILNQQKNLNSSEQYIN
jgi:predicted acylesterase/phospholipase RssA